LVKYIDPLIVCVSDKKIVMDHIAKSLAIEGWPIVFQATPDAALATHQDNLVSVIIDPLYNTACPSCGKLDDWANKNTKCECGFWPRRGKNVYLDWPVAKKTTVVILGSQAPKNTINQLKAKGYWAVKLHAKENSILDLPKVIKRSLKTMSKFYRM
jgi:hypothetical protein